MYCILLFGLFLISRISSVDNAPVLETEKIIGGHPASQSDFPYQAAILGKYNSSYSAYLLCSAGIISDYLLISAARCFVLAHEDLKKLSFFAAIDQDRLVLKDMVLKEIMQIYTYEYSTYGEMNDLAIARLKESLNLRNHSYLSALEIPLKTENFCGQTGIIAGFGVNYRQNLRKYTNRDKIRLLAGQRLHLKYANVTIVNDGECRAFYTNSSLIDPYTSLPFIEIRGIIQPDEVYGIQGVCTGDEGAPLVIDNKVVGIVSRHTPDCDDSEYGTVYTKVGNLKHFIDAIKENRHLSRTKYYDNPIHVTKLNTESSSERKAK